MPTLEGLYRSALSELNSLMYAMDIEVLTDAGDEVLDELGARRGGVPGRHFDCGGREGGPKIWHSHRRAPFVFLLRASTRRVFLISTMADAMDVDGGATTNGSEDVVKEEPVPSPVPPPAAKTVVTRSLMPIAATIITTEEAGPSKAPQPKEEEEEEGPKPIPYDPNKPHYMTRYILTGHARSISAVKFSPDGKLLASCGE